MTEQTPSAPRRDRGYVPTVLVGLAGAALAAVAGARDWATSQGDAAGIKVEASVTGAESQPLVAALALVALASWGVVLVSRGLARRAVAVVGLAASLGALGSVVLG
ncbi:MAG: Trp biosynthesis-associated membrane protein, partial [Nocardioidaceae bacterium]